jgi:hypothetical protein
MKVEAQQNLWNMAKSMLRGTFIAMSTYIKKPKESQINNLIIYFMLIEK